MKYNKALWLIYIALLFIIVLLLVAVTKVTQHYEAFEENPLLFGAVKYDINQCTCFTNNGKTFFFDQTLIRSQPQTPFDFDNNTTIYNGTI